MASSQDRTSGGFSQTNRTWKTPDAAMPGPSPRQFGLLYTDDEEDGARAPASSEGGGTKVGPDYSRMRTPDAVTCLAD